MSENNPQEFPAGENTFLIDGPQGKLEVLTLAAKEPSKGLGIICHPHPLHQGTMQNKVVFTLARAFQNKGAAARSKRRKAQTLRRDC